MKSPNAAVTGGEKGAFDLIVLNLKAYAESSGENGLNLIRTAHAVSKKTKKKIIVCPQPTQLHYARKNSTSNFWFFAQHVDANAQGAFTGTLTLEAVAEEGCKGTLINHSEKKVSYDHARIVVEKAKRLGLKTVICADTVEKGVLFSQLKPWAIAVEPPELIGSGISVSKARPQVVENAVRSIKSFDKRIIVLVGAGVSNAEDYSKCLALGAEGVLLASAFVKAQNPREWLESLVKVKA
ncbi:MAG: triose-phosphate isomerase [Candidatus Norongarragalinales archaeon]